MPLQNPSKRPGYWTSMADRTRPAVILVEDGGRALSELDDDDSSATPTARTAGANAHAISGNVGSAGGPLDTDSGAAGTRGGVPGGR